MFPLCNCFPYNRLAVTYLCNKYWLMEMCRQVVSKAFEGRTTVTHATFYLYHPLRMNARCLGLCISQSLIVFTHNNILGGLCVASIYCQEATFLLARLSKSLFAGLRIYPHKSNSSDKACLTDLRFSYH